MLHALSLDPKRILGGVVCHACIALPPEQLRAKISAMHAQVGIHPGARGGRNIRTDGGRA
jgi:hypothetical protein